MSFFEQEQYEMGDIIIDVGEVCVFILVHFQWCCLSAYFPRVRKALASFILNVLRLFCSCVFAFVSSPTLFVPSFVLVFYRGRDVQEIRDYFIIQTGKSHGSRVFFDVEPKRRSDSLAGLVTFYYDVSLGLLARRWLSFATTLLCRRMPSFAEKWNATALVSNGILLFDHCKM